MHGKGGVTAGSWGGQAALSGADALWAEAEYEAEFAFADGRRFEGAFRGLRPQCGVLTHPDGRRCCVAYSGDAWLAPDMQPVTSEVPPAGPP